MPYDPDAKPVDKTDDKSDIDYSDSNALGVVDDCYSRAYDLFGAVIQQARQMGVPIARLPDFLEAVDRVLLAYDGGDADTVMAAMDGVKRIVV